jgi:hypothetical protein
MGGGLWGVIFTPIIMNNGIIFGGPNGDMNKALKVEIVVGDMFFLHINAVSIVECNWRRCYH